MPFLPTPLMSKWLLRIPNNHGSPCNYFIWLLELTWVMKCVVELLGEYMQAINI